MDKLIIGAPFGNFFSSDHTVSVVGPLCYAEGNSLWRAVVNCFSSVRWAKGFGLHAPLRQTNIDIRRLTTWPQHKLRDRILLLNYTNAARWPELLVTAKMLLTKTDGASAELMFPDKVEQSELHMLLDFARSLAVSTIIRVQSHNASTVIKTALSHGYHRFHICPVMEYPLSARAISFNRLHVMGLLQTLKSSSPALDLSVTGWLKLDQDVQVYRKLGARRVCVTHAFSDPRLWLPWVRERRLQRMSDLWTAESD